MNRNYNNRNQSTRPETKLTINFTVDSYVDDAELVIKTLKAENRDFRVNRDVLTMNQLRNLLSYTSKLYDDILSNNVSSIKDQLAYLRVQFIYQSGRNDAVKEFIRLSQVVEKIKQVQQSEDRSEIIRFCRYMEALIAYFKYYGGKD